MLSVAAPFPQAQLPGCLREQIGLPNPDTEDSFQVPETKHKIAVRELASDLSIDPTIPALKVAYAQVRSEPGYLAESTATHKRAIKEAFDRGCHLIQFPELSMTNYCCHDLFLDRSFLKAQKAWLDKVVEFTKSTPGITAAVGFVDVDWSKERAGNRPCSYNAQAIIRDGKIIEIVHKKLLPNYSIFDERRWFKSGSGTKVIDINGVKVGFVICEDIWTQGYNCDPTKQLVEAGAQYISHPAASPIHLGKNETRFSLDKGITSSHKVAFGSVNTIGCYDGYEGDVPFDGRGGVFSKNGEFIAMGSPFKEELLILDPFHTKGSEIKDLIPIEEAYMSAIVSIQDYFLRLERLTGRRMNAMFGNSGGIDSAVIGVMLCDALGPDRVYSRSLPTKYNSNDTKKDTKILAELNGMHYQEMSIQKFYEAGLETLKEAVAVDKSSDHRIEQNLQARLRTVVLMAEAMAHDAIMINTSNKTERWTNNFTIYADSAGTIGPIADFDKDRIYEVARYINKIHGRDVIPASIIAREASAELAFDQVDANVMGDKPEVIAPHIRKIIESGANDFVAARKLLPDSVPDHLIQRWFGSIGSSEWKGRQITPGTRITPVAHGFGRRIPINHGWRGQLPSEN